MKLRITWFVCLAAVVTCVVWSTANRLPAQEAQGEAVAEAASAAEESDDSHRRLPTYFSDLVTPGQRARIYAIQDRYEPKLEELKQLMRELVAERDAEVESVLEPEQKKLLSVVKEQARMLREARAKAAARLQEKLPASTADAVE